MRNILPFILVLCAAAGAGILAQEKKVPAKIVFPSKKGDVVFNHEDHPKRLKEGCAACHDKLWRQEKGSFRQMKGKSSCRACHHPGGPAFATQGNCIKCHPGNTANPA